MEEIVKEIRAIKHLVALAAFSICFFVLGSLAQTMFAFQLMEPSHTGFNKPELAAFRDQADALLGDRKYDDLLTLASDHVKSQPDDPYGHWYLGLAHYHRAEYREAIDSLNRTEQLAPTWKEKSITPYVEAAQKALASGSN
ncbi:MAG TPA: tetratricopeptide repeat protein [Candidatus Krumholzibacteria bacterium]